MVHRHSPPSSSQQRQGSTALTAELLSERREGAAGRSVAVRRALLLWSIWVAEIDYQGRDHQPSVCQSWMALQCPRSAAQFGLLLPSTPPQRCHAADGGRCRGHRCGATARADAANQPAVATHIQPGPLDNHNDMQFLRMVLSRARSGLRDCA
jgi:hypothetical protein